MKEIQDLNVQRGRLINEANQLRSGKTNLTSEDQTKIRKMLDDVKAIDEQIAIHEQLNKFAPSERDEKFDNNFRNFDFGKAFRGASSNKLDGLEREFHQEMLRTLPNTNPNAIYVPSRFRTIDTTSQSAVNFPSLQGTPSTILPTQVLQELNPTLMSGLQGVKKLPLMSKATGYTKPAEKAAGGEVSVTQSTVELSPKRHSGFIKVTAEQAATFDPAIWNAYYNRFQQDISFSIEADYFATVIAAITASGSTTYANLDKKTLTDIEAAMINTNLPNMRFTTTLKGRSELKNKYAVAGAGASTIMSSNPLWSDANTVLGYGGSASNFSKTADGKDVIIFGSHTTGAVLGTWKAAELIINPFTEDGEGITKYTLSELACPLVWNADAFYKLILTA